eukprot:5300796-Alexandrium_andersonii.AAC.1
MQASPVDASVHDSSTKFNQNAIELSSRGPLPLSWPLPELSARSSPGLSTVVSNVLHAPPPPRKTQLFS